MQQRLYSNTCTHHLNSTLGGKRSHVQESNKLYSRCTSYSHHLAMIDDIPLCVYPMGRNAYNQPPRATSGDLPHHIQHFTCSINIRQQQNVSTCQPMMSTIRITNLGFGLVSYKDWFYPCYLCHQSVAVARFLLKAGSNISTHNARSNNIILWLKIFYPIMKVQACFLLRRSAGSKSTHTHTILNSHS